MLLTHTEVPRSAQYRFASGRWTAKAPPKRAPTRTTDSLKSRYTIAGKLSRILCWICITIPALLKPQLAKVPVNTPKLLEDGRRATPVRENEEWGIFG